MDIKKLQPGFYKVKKSNTPDSFRLLRVVDKGKAQKYYFGASIKGFHPDKIENISEFEVVSKYDSKPQVSESRITLSFKDAEGSTFNIPLEESSQVTKVFTALPWLKKHFVKGKNKSGTF